MSGRYHVSVNHFLVKSLLIVKYHINTINSERSFECISYVLYVKIKKMYEYFSLLEGPQNSPDCELMNTADRSLVANASNIEAISLYET